MIIIKQYEMNDLIGLLKHTEFIEILYALESSSCILLTNSNKTVVIVIKLLN